jgi:hypothetical protein
MTKNYTSLRYDQHRQVQTCTAITSKFTGIWICFSAAWKHTHLAIVAIFVLLLTMILDSFPAAPVTAVDCGQKNKFDQATITIIQLQHKQLVHCLNKGKKDANSFLSP